MADNLLAHLQEGAAIGGGEAKTASFTALTAVAGRKLMGYAVRESAGTPTTATWILRHGTSTAGSPFAFISLTASQYKDPIFFSTEGFAGVEVPSGVHCERLSGTIDLALYSVVRANA